MTIATDLAAWAHALEPSVADLALADRSLRDTVAVALAGAHHPVVGHAHELQPVGTWATAAHILDFDDLHIESTTHISAVIVPVVVAADGGARSYLAGAGVMSRLGAMLGWRHYERGWHATCTAGAPAAAAAAAVALGLDETSTATAMCLAVPAAGGVQRAFGTDAKSLQVGMAAEAGVRAARLAARGARADLATLEQWLELVDATTDRLDLSGDAVHGGVAIKLFPCCYAMQRPIHAVRCALGDADPGAIRDVVIRTPSVTTQPLIHHRPTTGLEGKFSLEYAVAAAVLDGFPTTESFTDEAVARPAAQEIVERVRVELSEGGSDLLHGSCDVELTDTAGTVHRASVTSLAGSPEAPPTRDDVARKFAGLGADIAAAVDGVTWDGAADLLCKWIASSGG